MNDLIAILTALDDAHKYLNNEHKTFSDVDRARERIKQAKKLGDKLQGDLRRQAAALNLELADVINLLS